MQGGDVRLILEGVAPPLEGDKVFAADQAHGALRSLRHDGVMHHPVIFWLIPGQHVNHKKILSFEAEKAMQGNVAAAESPWGRPLAVADCIEGGAQGFDVFGAEKHINIFGRTRFGIKRNRDAPADGVGHPGLVQRTDDAEKIVVEGNGHK